MRTLSSVLFLLGCVALVLHVAIRRQTQLAPSAPTLAGPFAVDGVTIGATELECRAVLGDEFEELTGNRTAERSLRWRTPRKTSVTFDAAGRARDITGSSLTDLAGQAALPFGGSLDGFRAALPAAKEQRHTRPTGSGVISLSRKHVGSTLTWRDERSAFSMGFDALGQTTFVRAEALR